MARFCSRFFSSSMWMTSERSASQAPQACRVGTRGGVLTPSSAIVVSTSFWALHSLTPISLWLVIKLLYWLPYILKTTMLMLRRL